MMQQYSSMAYSWSAYMGPDITHPLLKLHLSNLWTKFTSILAVCIDYMEMNFF